MIIREIRLKKKIIFARNIKNLYKIYEFKIK